MSEQITPYQVNPKTPLAGSAAAGIRDQGEISRRKFPLVLTTAWVALAAAVGGLASIFGRYLFPNVLFEPVQKFKAGLPGDYSVGEVDERWKEKYGIWIVRTEESMYALITTCTHLGCTPNWLAAENKFKCPCHGSGFYKSGVNFEGPAPRPLERYRVHLAEDGPLVVDMGDVNNPHIESAAEVCERVLEAARFIPLHQLGTTDDCGFSPFCDDVSTTRETAFAKIRARVEGTAMAARRLV